MTLLVIKKEIPFYYFKHLYKKDIVNYKDYVSTKEAYRIKYKDTFHKEEYVTIISNKLNFSLFCEHNQLPVPKLAGHNFETNFYSNGILYKVKTENEIVNFFDMVFSNTGWENIFIKPVSAYGGKGCYRINRKNIVKDVSACSQFILKNSCVHEEVVLQHDKINQIHPRCLNTLRLETFVDKKGEIHILSAFMRFGIGDSYVDNASSGGILVGIDFNKGALKEIGQVKMEFGGAEYKAHPNSKFVFANFEIPYFKEICDLVIKCVEFLPDRYIGWDIAISNNGPIIIEANEYPNIFTSDILYGGYLKHPLYKGIIKEVS